MTFIEVYMPDGRVERFDLEKPTNTLGRSPQADVTVDLPIVSRMHARLEKNPEGRWTLLDLGSQNKTRVDGHSIKSHVLTHKDVFYLGSVKAVFHDPSGESNEKKTEQTVWRKKIANADKPKQPGCPKCAAPLPEHAIVCVNCGYNTKTGQTFKLKVDGQEDGGHAYDLLAKPKPKPQDQPKPKTTLTTSQREAFLQWVLPVALIPICFGICIANVGLGGLIAFPILTLIYAVLLFLGSMIAAKLGEFGFSSLGNAILKYFGVGAVMALAFMFSSDFGFMAYIVVELAVMGLFLPLFFDVDFTGASLIFGFMFLLQMLLFFIGMATLATMLAGGSGE